MKEQIKKRIEDYKVELDKIDDKLFMNDMIDRWDNEDRRFNEMLNKQYKAIKEEIKVLEEELKNGKTN